jgi:hypothetical protein
MGGYLPHINRLFVVFTHCTQSCSRNTTDSQLHAKISTVGLARSFGSWTWRHWSLRRCQCDESSALCEVATDFSVLLRHLCLVHSLHLVFVDLLVCSSCTLPLSHDMKCTPATFKRSFSLTDLSMRIFLFTRTCDILMLYLARSLLTFFRYNIIATTYLLHLHLRPAHIMSQLMYPLCLEFFR